MWRNWWGLWRHRNYSQLDLLTGLIAYYRFQDNGADSSGNGHTATITAASYAAGIAGDGLSGGSSDQVAIGSLTTHTLSCWWKCNPDLVAGLSGGQLIMRRATEQPVGGILIAGVAGDAAAQITAGPISLPVVPNNGSWHHVVVVREGTVLTAYLDGVTAGTGAVSGSPVTKFDLNVTGDVATPLDEVAIYSVALTARQVGNLYNGGVGHDPTGGQ